ncbi:Scr1 family TA system antitoxin-like transcriptional regulator [Paractinoplanes atraurantiacus]|uniref:DUF5753 domain-containing protein n=1 Tax=Paractinoplanes atraurantiacus TaxID=1036182 RepID=A0A285JZ66_9ACTN|nr:Scr1 family TA system antitoxin-like transcriptional regulator [Actinoplanes atraurantiacus]SNY64371.1 hypothetical protein SAMN05421748_126120 [Actinoplanes atraurantiacus]
MIRQMEDMLDVIKHPNVTVQFMPFRSGAYRAMGGQFAVLEFDEPSDDNLLYLENAEGSLLYYENPERTEPYLRHFQDMERAATPPHKAADAINAVLSIYREGGFGITI